MNIQEFEIVTDKSTNYKVFLNVMKYRTPHLHLDYEIAYIMNGHMDLIYEAGEVYHLSPGDFMCINPYQIHEFRSDDNVRMLFLQFNPFCFKTFYPQIQNLEFDYPIVTNPASITGAIEDSYVSSYEAAKKHLFELALSNMEQKSYYELKCNGLLSMFFYEIMCLAPHHNASNIESSYAQNKATRMRKIADYIEEHLDEKILLSDIAKHEQLTLTYLSHFFKDNFRMTFQEYVTKLRCERARSLMLTTDLSLLDISLSCGFSDPKYFKNGFIKQYGCTPKEYQSNFDNQKLSGQQTSMLTTQQMFSRQTSLVLLRQYLDHEE